MTNKCQVKICLLSWASGARSRLHKETTSGTLDVARVGRRFLAFKDAEDPQPSPSSLTGRRRFRSNRFLATRRTRR